MEPSTRSRRPCVLGKNGKRWRERCAGNESHAPAFVISSHNELQQGRHREATLAFDNLHLSAKRSYVYLQKNYPHWPVRTHFMLDGDNTNGKLCLFEFVVPAEAKVPLPYYYTHVDEVLYSLSAPLNGTVTGQAHYPGAWRIPVHSARGSASFLQPRPRYGAGPHYAYARQHRA